MNVLNKGIEFSLSVSLLLVSLARNSDSNSVRKIADSLRPDELVELRINSDVSCSHHLSNPFFDFLESSGGLFLELCAMSQFMYIDSGINGSLSESSSLLFLYHSTN